MSTVKTIDAATANEWIENHEAILIDVREPIEYQEVHIDGAHLIPLGSIELKKLPQNVGDKKIIMQCRMGQRSSVACKKLLDENKNLDIYNLSGGITAWENAGFKVIKP